MQTMTQKILLSGIYATEMWTYVHQKTWTQMFRESVFVIVSNMKQSKLSIVENTKQFMFSYTKILHSNEWTKIKYNNRNKPHKHKLELKKPDSLPLTQQKVNDSNTQSSKAGQTNPWY